MNNNIFELNDEEVEVITGASDVNPPTNVAGGDEYPMIDNNPP